MFTSLSGKKSCRVRSISKCLFFTAVVARTTTTTLHFEKRIVILVPVSSVLEGSPLTAELSSPDGDLTFPVSIVQLGNELVDQSLHGIGRLHPLQLLGVVKHDGIFYYLVVILMSTPRRQALS